MSRKYLFGNKEGLYFVSFATVYWMDVFVRDEYCSIITESLAHCRKSKGMKLYCWCIMPSHMHMIFSARDGNPGALLGRFKEYTSKALRKAIQENVVESRREWLLWMMKRAASQNSSVSEYQFWQHNNQPIELWSRKVIEQKINYIHNNPVKAGFVMEPQHWRYSSAIDYCGGRGLVELDVLW
jgi:REP element-mobilizing transposase RayT